MLTSKKVQANSGMAIESRELLYWLENFDVCSISYTRNILCSFPNNAPYDYNQDKERLIYPKIPWTSNNKLHRSDIVI